MNMRRQANQKRQTGKSRKVHLFLSQATHLCCDIAYVHGYMIIVLFSFVSYTEGTKSWDSTRQYTSVYTSPAASPLYHCIYAPFPVLSLPSLIATQPLSNPSPPTTSLQSLQDSIQLMCFQQSYLSGLPGLKFYSSLLFFQIQNIICYFTRHQH